MNSLLSSINTIFPGSNSFVFNNNSISFKNCNKTYIIKHNKNNIIEKYNYLKSRGFNSVPNISYYNNDVYVYERINSITNPDEYKIKDIINLLIQLHSKTTYYKELSPDEVKEIYEDIIIKIKNTYDYYMNLIDKIENELYYSPSNYLLLRNSSLIFNCLDFSNNVIKKWYESVSNNRKVRFVLLHNNLSLDHEINNGENKILLSFDSSKDGMCIYDIIMLFKKYYYTFDFIALFKEYNSKMKLSNDEERLLFALLYIPDKIEFNDAEISNTKDVYNLCNYLYKVNDLFMKNKPKDTEEKDN